MLVPVRLPRPRAEPPPGPVWAWLTPAFATLAMAVALRTPVLAVLALGTLLPLAPRLPRPARRRPWGPEPAEATVLAAQGAEPELAWWSAAHEGLALVGERGATLAAARALLGAALLDPRVQLTLALGGGRATDWQLVPMDRPGAGRAACRRGGRSHSLGRRRQAPRGRRRRRASGPASLVGATGRGRGRRAGRAGRGRPRLVPPPDPADERTPRASAAWIEAQARRIAARTGAAAGLPAAVPLADLLREAARPSGRPGTAPPGLAAPLGMGPAGPVVVDLVADGPHALVAGTTGAGKSELLQTLVLALASRYGPDRLALVLVDFKGGAGLGACHRLPHVVGTVTDLDPHAAARALAGVRAELRRREGLLAAAGVGDLEALRAVGPAPPRLLVVVDELLALREDLPDVLPALVRLASQGRSLGIHLVLATQRPAGALDAQVRANVGVRLCLRVTDTSDSLDVVGTAEAATIPADLPGRAVLRRGDQPPEPLQTAWAALPPSPRGPIWAPPWPPVAAPRGRSADDEVAALVTDLIVGARGSRPAPLWRPPLPARCAADAIGALVGGPDGPGARPDARRTGRGRDRGPGRRWAAGRGPRPGPRAGGPARRPAHRGARVVTPTAGRC